MKRIVLIALAIAAVASLIAVFRPSRNVPAKAADAAMPMPQEKKILYWVDPMHPAYKSDRPGKAPDCGMDLVPVYEGGEVGQADPPPGTVKIDAAKQQLIGVTYGTVEHGPLTYSIRAVGKVAVDETKVARIHPKIEGWIEQVNVDFTGRLVRKGERLLSIYSPELLSAEKELLIAKRAQEQLGKNEDEEIARNSVNLYQSARERMRLWDMTDQQIAEIEATGKPYRAMSLYAPVSGFVMTRNAYEKQRVTPETELYAIADLSSIWIIADVYEYEAQNIRLGQRAQIDLSYIQGKRFQGVVDYIFPQVDPATRTLKVRVQVPNPGYELKPDMFANVEFKADFGEQLYVDEAAVLDSGAEQIVFVARDGGYFEPRKVQLGAKLGNRYIVTSGLIAGERIVTSGNFLIDSESRLKSGLGAMAGHSGHGGTPAPAQEPEHKDHQPQPPQPKPPAAPRSPISQEDHSQPNVHTHGGGGL